MTLEQLLEQLINQERIKIQDLKAVLPEMITKIIGYEQFKEETYAKINELNANIGALEEQINNLNS